MRLGTVVKSNNHCDYVVQVDDRFDVAAPPQANDYGFGCFVKLALGAEQWAVGLIYNTQLFNPAFMQTGPRLASEANPIFSPDLQVEVRTLLSVAIIGTLDLLDSSDAGYGQQGIPTVVIPVNAAAWAMNDEEILQFHRNAKGDPQFAYYGLLLTTGGTFAPHLICRVLDQLSLMFFGDQRRALEILSKEMAWKMTMGAIR